MNRQLEGSRVMHTQPPANNSTATASAKGLTLRQQFEQKSQNNPKSATKLEGRSDSFLRALLGKSVTITFQDGTQVSSELTAMDRFTLRVSEHGVIFKHAVRSVRSNKNPADVKVVQQ